MLSRRFFNSLTLGISNCLGYSSEIDSPPETRENLDAIYSEFVAPFPRGIIGDLDGARYLDRGTKAETRSPRSRATISIPLPFSPATYRTRASSR